MKFFIIRNIKTLEWLGNSRQRNKTAANFTSTEPPRLFNRRIDAINAMNCWLLGEWHCDRYDNTCIPFRNRFKIRKLAYRNYVANDLEIQEIKICRVSHSKNGNLYYWDI